MKEFIEKLIKKLEEEINWYETHGCNEKLKRAIIGANRHAIGIVNELAEEYINTSIDTSTTNADRIRSMNDEELARFLSKTVWEEGANLFDCSDYTCGYPCMECKGYLDWLQSEVKGSDVDGKI